MRWIFLRKGKMSPEAVCSGRLHKITHVTYVLGMIPMDSEKYSYINWSKCLAF